MDDALNQAKLDVKNALAEFDARIALFQHAVGELTTLIKLFQSTRLTVGFAVEDLAATKSAKEVNHV